ncbi:MAG TPA: hypothetical protein VN783_14545 [Thermoanaerobaculia bacterium]|nr:hypothetical protein [Thermoanaerobaculia bacterium]
MKIERQLAFLLGLLAAGVAGAQAAPTISADKTECLPAESNGVITARMSPEIGGSAARTYFRWKDHGNFYFVPMTPKGEGRYWTVLPKPERRNETVEYYAAVVLADGREIARSKMLESVVKADCRMPLTEKEAGLAANMIIGETAQPQNRRAVLGFMCEGIVSRLDARGVLRADDLCRTCVVAFWQKRAIFGPIATATAVVIDREPDPSDTIP